MRLWARSARQLRKPHEEFIDGPGALPALPDRPYDERLATPNIACGEDLGHARYIGAFALGIGARIPARILLHAEFLDHRLERRDEAHRQQDEIGRHFDLGPRHFNRLAVPPIELHRLQGAYFSTRAEKLLG